MGVRGKVKNGTRITTMQDWLRARATATPEGIALIFNEESWTWRELDALTSRLCAKLKSLNIRPGAYIGVLMTNSPEAVIAVHALARAKCVMVPLNTRLTPVEMGWQLQQTGVGLLLHNTHTAEQAQKLVVNCYQVNLSQLPEADAPAVAWPLEATQAIVFTSGTSGRPKGAEITFGNHYASATASAFRIGHHTNDIWLSILPLYHVGGLAVILRCTLYGITTLLHQRFDLHSIQLSFQQHSVTLISLVPTMLHRMLMESMHFPPSLRVVLLGGAAATPELLQQALDAAIPVTPTYGLTEASSQVATVRPGTATQKLGSVGRPLMFTEVVVVDEKRQPLPAGEYGEVVVRGPTVMRGYYRNPEATKESIHDGWLYTGDIGYLDEDGDLWLVQRRSDLIVTGGENVYPVEIEAVLRHHPLVSDVSVVGIDDVEWGQQVAAAIVPEEETMPSIEELVTYCRHHLAAYKCPRRFVFVDEFPKTASGKVQRGRIRELFDGS
jgi:O-succinylbenzoic acid--CoA ligase